MAGKIILVATFFLLVTVVHLEQSSLPTTHAATERTINSLEKHPAPANIVGPQRQQQSQADLPPLSDEMLPLISEQSCYSFMRRRPAYQRAEAVQARLNQADRMTSAFQSELLTVDIVGDHANILALQFPAVWPDKIAYVRRVSSVVEDYFAIPAVKDYMCQAGFAKVTLSAQGLSDERIHAVWTAKVTSVGLVKARGNGEEIASASYK